MGNNINNRINMMSTSDLGNVKFGMGGANLGFGWAENALTCDSEGNCMLKDELVKIGGKFGKMSGSVKFDDDDLVDDLGRLGKAAKGFAKGVGRVAKAGANFAGTKVLPKVTRAFTGGKVGATVRIRDELVKIGGKIGRISGSVSFDDDLIDDLALFTAIKEKRQAAKAMKAAKKAAKLEVEVKDELVTIGGKIGNMSGSIKFDDDDLVDDLSKAGDRIKGAFKKVGSGIAKGAKGVAKGVKKAVSRPKVEGCAGRLCLGAKFDDDDDLVDDGDLVDDLGSAKGKIGKFSGGIKWADNSLTCDSEGNCMLKDELKSERVKTLTKYN